MGWNFRAVASAVLAAVLGSAALTGCQDNTDPSSGERIAVLSWNLCAPASRLCPYGGQIKTKTNAVVRNVVRNRASVVLLQEACATIAPKLEHALELRERAFLAEDRQPWTVRFVPQYEPNSPELTAERCKDWKQSDPDRADPEAPRGEHGLIIALRGKAAPNITEVLPSPPDMRHRVATCVRQQDPVKLSVCTTQLSQGGEDPTGEFRIRQVNRLNALAREAERAGYHSIVGGDLNTAPEARGREKWGTDDALLGRLYSSATECSGEPTEGSQDATVGDDKFDYIFVGGGLELTGCDVTTTDYSDHDLMVATVSAGRAGQPS